MLTVINTINLIYVNYIFKIDFFILFLDLCFLKSSKMFLLVQN